MNYLLFIFLCINWSGDRTNCLFELKIRFFVLLFHLNPNLKTYKMKTIARDISTPKIFYNLEIVKAETAKSRKNIKSDNRISLWLDSHNFSKSENKNSDLVNFLENCPLGEDSKKLSVHNTNITKTGLTLMLKERDRTLCFNFIKVEGGFLIKTTEEQAWVFNEKGELVKRSEHKKTRIWLEKQGLPLNRESPSDLEIFLSSCPICRSKKPLRFHRSAENRLDLQCGCINYFRLLVDDKVFEFTHRSKVLLKFNSKGEKINL